MTRCVLIVEDDDDSREMLGELVSSFGHRPLSAANAAEAIAQTREGYLWFATWGGIVRYNGQEFRTFGRHNVPDLRDNGMRGATVGPSGALVLATSRADMTPPFDFMM